MRPLLAILLLVGLVLSGCASNGGKDDDPSSSGTGTTSGSKSGSASKGPTSSGSSTQTGTGAPANKAPVGGIAATVNGTSVQFNLTGTDPDGDALTWTLSFGDGSAGRNGTTLPANATHTYTVGNHTAHYNLTDGRLNATYNVTFQVAAVGGTGTTAVFTEGQEFPSNPANSLVIPNVGYAGATGCAGYWDGTSGVDCVFFELEAGWAGKAFTATADAGNPDLEFWPVCDPAEVFAVAGFNADGPEAGAIPAGALCVVIWNGEPSMDTPTHTFTVA